MTKKKAISLIFVLCFIFVILTELSAFLGRKSEQRSLLLDDYITTKINRLDGTVEYYDGSFFEAAKKGEIVTFYISLPEEKRLADAVLTCTLYQCVITLSYQNRILYSYGADVAEKGHQIGNVYMIAGIPEEAWGKTVELRCDVVDYTSFSKINQVYVYNATERVQTWLSDKLVAFMMSIAGLFLFSLMFLFLLLWRNTEKIRTQGIFLALFCISIIVWRMGYEGHFYVLTANIAAISNLEYIGLFAAVPLFFIFLSDIETNNKMRQLLRGLSIASGAFLVITTILNYTTENFHYCRFLKWEHVMIGCMIVISGVGLLRMKGKVTFQQSMIRFGIVQYIFFVILDLGLYYLDQKEWIGKINRYSKSVSSIGLFLFLLCLIISYVSRVMEYFIGEKEKERLERMAYLDGMTGIPNRNTCIRKLQELDQAKEYSIAFFDVNDLKLANDKYGHDVGDHLICSVAKAIWDTFGEKGFCGRYGGDEFVSCVYDQEAKEIRSLLGEFEKKIEKMNEDHEFAFPVRVAFGYASCAERQGITKEEVIKLADQRMYEYKKESKGDEVHSRKTDAE